MIDGVPALSLAHVVKCFGRVTALSGASFTLRPGTVHALLGENGAGKTTLMRIAFGMEQPDSGVVCVNGIARRFQSPADAIAAGIGMVHQHFTVVPAMTVAENIALGRHGRFDPATVANSVRSLGAEWGLHLDPLARARDISVTSQQRLEILKAISRDARVLILDEPTAVLAPGEVEDLLRQIRRLADTGRAIVLITHKLREALSVADVITVLRRGSTVMTATPDAVGEEQLIAAMLGEGAPRAFAIERPPVPTDAPVVIRARALRILDDHGVARIHDATFDVRGGEVVGVAAVAGAGHRELLRAVAGRHPIASGTLQCPLDVGFVPEDRHREGLVLDMSLAENYALRDAGLRQGRIRWTQIEATTTELLDDFDVRAESARTPARALSGGNQQKFIVARELAGFPPALVADNPTRGLDVRATQAIHDRLMRARSRGVAVLVHSTDLDDVLALADRILVVHAGLVGETPVDRDAVGRAMLGAV